MQSYGHAYDSTFYDYVQIGATRSARVVVPAIIAQLQPRSVLDVGCGRGVWLLEYMRRGVPKVLGLDGDYVPSESLLIPSEYFRAQDLRQAFDLGERYDVVQCLEVAEHVEPSSAPLLIANLTRHGARVLFSAAPPGQGGESHVNEQSYEHWRRLFAERGFVPFDSVRPLIRSASTVEPWYRYNMILYVHEQAIRGLPGAVSATRIAGDEPIRDVSPLVARVCRSVLRRFSPRLVSRIAIAKHKMALALLRSAGAWPPDRS